MSMTSDKAEWHAFAIWANRVALCSSTLFCSSGSTFDSVITEKLPSPHLLSLQLEWKFSNFLILSSPLLTRGTPLEFIASSKMMVKGVY